MTSRQTEALLCRLADPEAPVPNVPLGHLPRIAQMASDHNVGPVVLRKLAGTCDPEIVSDLKREVEATIALTLRLRGLANDVSAFIRENGVAATMVKGRSFATRLYPVPGDRPFTDIDILVSPDAREAFAGFLTDRGFRLHKRAAFDNTVANQEEKWLHEDVPALLIEVHGNLVHYEGLRRRVSFSYDDLIRIDPDDPEAPLCLFFLAVVHGTLGHKLHQIRFLVDVLQAFRKLDTNDREKLPQLAADLHLSIETALCLRLIAEVFDETAAAELASRFTFGPLASLGRDMITAQVVIDAPYSRMSRLRRHAFRWIQRTIRR